MRGIEKRKMRNGFICLAEGRHDCGLIAPHFSEQRLTALEFFPSPATGVISTVSRDSISIGPEDCGLC